MYDVGIIIIKFFLIKFDTIMMQYIKENKRR